MLNSSGFIDSSKNTALTSLGCQISSGIRRKKRGQEIKYFVFCLTFDNWELRARSIPWRFYELL